MMRPEVQNKQDKGSLREDTSTKINKTIELNIINSIEGHIKKWMNTIGTLSENSFQECFSECSFLDLL